MKPEMRMTHTNLQISSAAISDKGLSEKRPNNEDSYLELRDCGLFAVADGVGGAQAGDVASQMAMEILGEAFVNLPEGGDAEERMRLAIEQANGAIFQMSNDLAKLSTMATTVVGLHLRQNVATIGHVGDSRLYRVDPEGNLFQETDDHSVVEEEVRAGRMTPAQAAVHPSRNVISRALGADDVVEVDKKTIMFEPGTTFLVCSDGVTRHIPDEELQALLFNETDPFEICQYIKKTCYERGAQDNLTAVVVKVSSPDEPDIDEIIGLSLDEDTIASVKPPLVNSNVLTDALENTVETADEDMLSTKPLEESLAFETVNTKQPKQSETISFKTDKSEETENLVSEEKLEKVEDIKSFRIDEKGVPDLLGKVLGVIPWVVLGVALTLLSYLVWFQWFGDNTPKKMSDLNIRNDNLVLTSFETLRRNVDADPAKYIANSATPKDAIDHYLLGRAHFLQKNYADSKTHLDSAKSKLEDGVSLTNKNVLGNDIPMMLAIINSSEAQKSLEQDENAKNKASSNSNTPASNTVKE